MTIAEYDALAERFRRDTGLVAPGKDVAAAAADGTSYEERVEAWRAWLAEKGNAIQLNESADEHAECRE